MDRRTLPLRVDCEGYFTDSLGNILAKPSDKGYVIFPGGGVDDGEELSDAIRRETLEETGAKIQTVRYLGNVSYEWPEGWAQTEKQKRRYEQFRGDEMHFFVGTIESFVEINDEEDTWQGQKLTPISEVIALIEQMRPFPEALEVYYSAQLRFLKSL